LLAVGVGKNAGLLGEAVQVGRQREGFDTQVIDSDEEDVRADLPKAG
jgi:hypothetical protein